MTLVASAVDPEISAALVIYNRLQPLKDALGISSLTDSELQLFAMVAQHTGLDPFTKQLYAVKRAGKVVHQTGIDGYRSTAERTKQYAGSDETEFEACDCGQEPKDHPRVARTTVHRLLPNGHVVDQVGVARWHELYPGPGEDGFMWRKMPHNQLSKCSEANGLRKAFPRVLGGVYIEEEMAQASIIEGEATEVTKPPTTAERIAAKRAEREAQQPTVAEAPSEPVEPEGEEAGEEVPLVAASAAPEPDSLSRDALRHLMEHHGVPLATFLAAGRELYAKDAGFTDAERAGIWSAIRPKAA
jgi:phage recombination protein Bet